MEYRICRVIRGRSVSASIPLLQRCLQIVSFLSILIILLVWLLMRRNVLAPLNRLNRAMEQIEENNLDYRLTNSEQTLEFQYTQSVFNHMAEQIQHLKIEAYEKDIEEELFGENVSPLLIQNFMENSIKYALKLGSEIEILVVVKKKEDKLTISVVDTGCGMEESVLKKLKAGDIFEDSKGKHIGIWNCRRWLKVYYGEAAVLNISSPPGEGTQVWIEIPVEVQDAPVDCG